MNSISRTSSGPMLPVLMLIGATLMLSGCAKTMATGAIKPACSIWLPIAWSGADTDETIRGVKSNNAARQSYCE